MSRRVYIGAAFSANARIGPSVPIADGVLIASRRQAFDRVFTDRLQHQEPRLARRFHPAQQALVAQGRDAFEHIDVEARTADLLGMLDRKPSDEDTEPGEQATVLLVEEVVAPFDGAPEGALALGEVAGAAGQQAQPGAETITDSFQGQQADPGRGQFDGQGQAVEPGDDVGDERSVLENRE